MGCDDLKAPIDRCPYCAFQSTHPHGVRLVRDLSAPARSQFQSTHPHGVRRGGSFRRPFLISNFNPRTRMGCDQRRQAGGQPGGISIHAPAWGATTRLRAVCLPISDFNPRTRMGCDFLPPPFPALAGAISIHAPAWGATLSLISPAQRPAISIHAPAWGATFEAEFHKLYDNKFQSTHPHGVRQLIYGRCLYGRYFNPRTRMGCDP